MSHDGTTNVTHQYFGGPVTMQSTTVHRVENANLGVNNGNMYQQGNRSHSSCGEGQDHLIEASRRYLAENMAAGALHDSEERVNAPKCMPETRIAVQTEIISWISDGHKDSNPKRILWVTGPAGTGKTAIMGSIAEQCKERGIPAISFFFSNRSNSPTASNSLRSKKRLVSTLAYQLLQDESLELGEARISTSKAVQGDPAILRKSLQTQLDNLILRPLRQLEQPEGEARGRMAILIDGLDECDLVEDEPEPSPTSNRSSLNRRRTKEEDQREILSILLHAASQETSSSIILILASRPEPAIRSFFSNIQVQAITRELFLAGKYGADADIRLFYEARLSEIRRRYDLPSDWPGAPALYILVRDASGQFIYAATAMRFIEDSTLGTQDGRTTHPGLLTPHQRLQRILELRPQAPRAESLDSAPLEALNILYTSLLRTCPEPRLSVHWLQAIRILRVLNHDVYNGPAPPWLVRLVLELSPGEEQSVLGPLSSMLKIPSGEDRKSSDKLYTFYHASFLDFIDTKTRCNDLYVSPEEVKDFISRRYFQTLNNHFNRIPAGGSLYYLAMDFPGEPFLKFSSKATFRAAESAIISCNVRIWAQYVAEAHTTHKRYFVRLMFSMVHQGCSWHSSCRPACKHWRETMLDALGSKGWTVPTASQRSRSRWSDIQILEWDFSPPKI
ncbi:hypothetical protein DFP72DRAFT_932865 [Ephemerocybe angulata]|uniref:NACHT domain-containing protein n=1 Tax=Ephemerocybe angulata TaxID=980116 RepID=A0A8H6HAN0_9AGAR|nr:hypothetical protein DFP72DRAFT_932865 [Tulosesus angulatus]